MNMLLVINDKTSTIPPIFPLPAYGQGGYMYTSRLKKLSGVGIQY